MKRKPMVYGEYSPYCAPKLFSKGFRGGRQRKARATAVFQSVEQLIAHGKIHIADGWNSNGHLSRVLELGPAMNRVADDDQRRPNGPLPWGSLRQASEAV